MQDHRFIIYHIIIIIIIINHEYFKEPHSYNEAVKEA